MIEFRRQAADCRAALGQVTLALQQFASVLEQVRAIESDSSDTAIDLRRNIGVLLLSDGKNAQAADILGPLYDDLCIVRGPDDEETQEIAELLARLHLK